MGTYISIPYVTRRSVSVEPSKPITVQTTKVDSIPEEEPVKQEVVKEDPKVEPKEDPKEEPKVEPKVELKNKVIEAEVVIPELLPKSLPENEIAPDLSEKVTEAQRIPEFQGNVNPESHAIKKFNRRHRKHQQN